VGGGIATLRGSLAVALALLAVGLVATALLGGGPVATVGATDALGTPTPSATVAPTPTPTIRPTETPTFRQTPPPTATPAPTPTPTPIPATAAATVPPTAYAEQINPDQSLPTIAPISVNSGIVPRPAGGGSPLPEILLLGIVVCAVIAGTAFFLFFRVR